MSEQFSNQFDSLNCDLTSQKPASKSMSAQSCDLYNTDKSSGFPGQSSDFFQFTGNLDSSGFFINIPDIDNYSAQESHSSDRSAGLIHSRSLEPARSIQDHIDAGLMQQITPAQHLKTREGLRCIPQMTYIMAERNGGSSAALRTDPLNYYKFNAEERSSFKGGTPQVLDNLQAQDGLKKRERLAPGETQQIKIVYEDISRSKADTKTLPDFRVTKDGIVQVINNPETNPLKEIVIEVERASGFIGLPSEAQLKSLVELTNYLSARLGRASETTPEPLVVSDNQGLLSEEANSPIESAPPQEEALPPPVQDQTQALNRIDGSGSGSMSPSEANDYFPPSKVPTLPNESPSLSALKDLIAGFETRGITDPYNAVQRREGQGFAVGRYALTAGTIFDWISGLSDAEIDEIEELEITTPDGIKKKIKIPKDTGAKLRKIRALVKTAKGTPPGKNGAPESSDGPDTAGERENAIDQLFDDLHISYVTRLLAQMQEGKDAPSPEQVSKALSPEIQELIATDLIYKFAKECTDPATEKVNIGKVVLSMHLGRTFGEEDLTAPENLSLMKAAEQGYPLALQHTVAPEQPVQWTERNGKVSSDPNSYFFSQFRNETYNPTGPSRSNNCGPASLAMAAKAFDKDGDISNVEKQIDRARVAMTGRNNYSELTSLSQISNGAKKLGMQTSAVADLNSVNNALYSGKQVVLFGNPAGAYGNRLSGSQYSHYNGLHFILVAEKGQGAQGNYLINDPLSRKGSITVSAAELSRFMRRDASGRSGIAVWA